MVNGCNFLGHEVATLMDLRKRWINTMRQNGSGAQIELTASRTDAKFEELFMYMNQCDGMLTMYGNAAREKVIAEAGAPEQEPAAEAPLQFPTPES